MMLKYHPGLLKQQKQQAKHTKKTSLILKSLSQIVPLQTRRLEDSLESG